MLSLFVDVYVDEGVGEVGAPEISVERMSIVEELAYVGVCNEEFSVKHASTFFVSAEFDVVTFPRCFWRSQELSGTVGEAFWDWKRGRRRNGWHFAF